MFEEIYIGVLVATFVIFLIRKKFPRVDTDSDEDDLLCTDPMELDEFETPFMPPPVPASVAPQTEPMDIDEESDETSSSDFELKQDYY